MNRDFEVIKNTTFIICIVITIIIIVVGSWAIIRYSYEAEENERLRKQIEQQTTLIEYLKENNLESKGEDE